MNLQTVLEYEYKLNSKDINGKKQTGNPLVLLSSVSNNIFIYLFIYLISDAKHDVHCTRNQVDSQLIGMITTCKDMYTPRGYRDRS